MLVIFALSDQPADRLAALPPLFPHADKVVHALLYAILLGCFRWAFVPRTPAVRWVPLSLAFTLAYAVVDEVHQSYVPGRSPDAADLAADFAGALVAAAALVAVGRRRGARAAHGTQT
ncbi:MAG: VanZ family protein [Planctomycetota bacterium]